MKSVRIIRKDEAAVSPVIATILMVAITVVLAAVLYVMVSGLISGPGSTPRAMGVNIQRSSDATNWTLLISSSPSGLLTADTKITIRNPGGAIVLNQIALTSLVWATHGAIWQSDGDTTVEATESILLRAASSTLPTSCGTCFYPLNSRVEISDATSVLFSGTLAL